MNWRIRLYFAIVAARHIGTGILLTFDGERFDGAASFDVLYDVLGPVGWALLLLPVGAVALSVVFWPSMLRARAAAVASVGLSTAWASSFALVKLEEPSGSVLLVIVFASLAVKDLIVSGMAYSNPIEELVRREEIAPRAT